MKYTRNPDLVSAEMDGDVVMMSIENGMYYGLTGTALQIWEVLTKPHTAAELLAKLLPLYEVNEEILHADVDVFLVEMQENGLVKAA